MLWNLQVVLALFLTLPLASRAQDNFKVLEEIEVKGTRLNSKSTQISEGTDETVEINHETGETPVKALQKTPGIWIQQGSQESMARITIKGQVGNENRYFLEGVALTDGQYHSDFLFLVPAQYIGGADVYSDGAPVGLNADGLGGAIDLHVVRFKSPKVAAKSGSYGFIEITGSSPVLPKERGGIGLSVSRSNENFNFFDDGGTPLNSSDDKINNREHNSFLKLSLAPSLVLLSSSNHNLKYFGINSFRKLEVPGAVSIPFYGALDQWFHLSAVKDTLWLFPELKNETTAFVRINRENFKKESAQTTKNQPSITEAFWKSFTIKNQVQAFSLMPAVAEQAVSLNYEVYDLSYLEWDKKKLQNSKFDIPFSLGLKFPLASLTIKPAVLAQYTKYIKEDAPSYALYSPRLGLEWREPLDFKNIIFSGVAGKYFRMPSMSELFGNGYYLAPSNSLEPETANKIGLGLMWQQQLISQWIKHIKMGYNFSLAQSKNLIVYTQNSQSSQIATNLGSALVANQDLFLELNLARQISSLSAFNLCSGKNTSEIPYYFGKQVPNLPAWLIKQRIDSQWGWVTASYQLSWIGERYWDLANTKKLSSTLEHSAWVNYQYSKNGKVQLELINLTDEYVAKSSVSGFTTLDNTTGLGGYPAPGRRVYLSWLYDF